MDISKERLLLVYDRLKANDKKGKLQRLRFDWDSNTICYEEYGRKYRISKIGKFFFHRPDNHRASSFLYGDELLDFVLESIHE